MTTEIDGLTLLASAAERKEEEEKGQPGFSKEEDDAIEAHLNMAREVAHTIGVGRVERVYHNAINCVLTELGTEFESEEQFAIKFYSVRTQRSYVVANERLDVRTIGCKVPFILELKAVARIDDGCYVQLIHYMEHFAYRFGAVINFGNKQWQMMVVYRSDADGKYYLFDPLTRAVSNAPRHTYT